MSSDCKMSLAFIFLLPVCACDFSCLTKEFAAEGNIKLCNYSLHTFGGIRLISHWFLLVDERRA